MIDKYDEKYLNPYRPFRVVFMGPTNHRGARIQIRDLRNGVRVVLPYDYSVGDILTQGRNHLMDIGIIVTAAALADYEKGYILLTQNFLTDLKK